MSKRRQRFFAISHSANKRPRYTHNSGLELLSSSEEDTDSSSSITHSVSRKSVCPRCVVLDNEIKWLRSRIEKYEEGMQARIDKLERLLLLALDGKNDNSTKSGVFPSHPSMVSSVPEDVADFGGITISSMESPNISAVTEASILPEAFPFIPEVFSNNILPSTNIPDISVVDDDNNDCI